MIAYLAWFIVILGAACAVFVMAAKVTDDRPDAVGLRNFLRHARAGARSMRRPSRPSTSDVTVVSAGPEVGRSRRTGDRVDRPVRMTSLDDFFAAAEATGSAYVQAEDITGPLERAREAVRSHHLGAQVRAWSAAGGNRVSETAVQPVLQPARPRARAGHIPAGPESTGSGPGKGQVQRDAPAA